MKTLVKCTLSLALLTAMSAYANDSIGYVATGGVEYIKNDKISMHSENLYISPKKIKVDYQFKNLSNKDITETVLFPLPPVPFDDGITNFASTEGVIDSFKITVNGKAVKPEVHVRAFYQPNDKAFNPDEGVTEKPIDVTDLFKSCGLTDSELQYPWTQKGDWNAINHKLASCKDPKFVETIGRIYDEDLESYAVVSWSAQLIYSWKQTFKANTTTSVSHSYAPLLGGAVSMVDSQYPYYCVDKGTQSALKRSKLEYGKPYRSLGYILTTGANWAKPISDFKLTVERDSDEVVSFCWAGKGKVTKVGEGKFQVVEKNFTPTQDLDIAFIKVK